MGKYQGLEGWASKWQTAKFNAKNKGVEFLLSFDEYVELAKEAGLADPEQIGCNLQSYCLARMGDIGPYSKGNCRFATVEQNLQEKKLNGGNAVQARKMSKAFSVLSPDGKIYNGLNLKTFCASMGLNQGEMSAVCRGVVKHHKGWTGKYVQLMDIEVRK